MTCRRRAMYLLLLIVVLAAATDKVLGRPSCLESDTVVGRSTSMVAGLRKALWQSSAQAWNSRTGRWPSSISSDDEYHHLMVGSSMSVSFADQGPGCHQEKLKQNRPKKQQQRRPTRFASIHGPQEAREITFTVVPHLKKQESHKKRNSSHTKAEFEWLDGGHANPHGRHDKPNVALPCSVRPVVAMQQGRFAVDEARRSVPSFSTMTLVRRITSKEESSTFTEKSNTASVVTRGSYAAVAAAAAPMTRPLLFWENMISGAVSRSIAQTVMHPANTMKTILQSSRGPNRPTLGDLFHPQMFRRLTRGAGANFALSIPHGAINFAVLEFVRGRLNRVVESVSFLDERKDAMGPGLDFLSSAISTICCSVVSTPQMMVTDNIMAGNYPNLVSAIKGLYSNRGISGFYTGWWPGLAGKIPSYALTWTFFQQLKRIRSAVTNDRPAKNYENTAMGCIASAATVCIMIPMDTIKTRLVTQTSAAVTTGIPYKGILDCAVRVSREEGIRTLYRGLAPRLLSVVPMIGIQFATYEYMKKLMLQRTSCIQPVELISAGGVPNSGKAPKKGVTVERVKCMELQVDRYGPEECIKEAAMEVAASASNAFPAPRFLKKLPKEEKRSGLQEYFSFSSQSKAKRRR